MKAMMVTDFGGTEFLKLKEIDIPKIKADEVLIRVIKTSVNYADIKSRYGKKEQHCHLSRVWMPQVTLKKQAKM